MLTELKREVGRLVVMTTATVTGKILTPEDQRRLAEETSKARDGMRRDLDSTEMRANKQTRREAKQLFRLCLVNGLLDENRARQVVQQIVDAKPRGYLATLSQFRRLVKLDYAQHTAKVESAMPLPSDLQASVQMSLANVYGPGLTTSFVDDPR